MQLALPDSTVWHLEKRTPRPLRPLWYLISVVGIVLGFFLTMNIAIYRRNNRTAGMLSFFLLMAGVMSIPIIVTLIRKRKLHDNTLFVIENNNLYRVMPNLAKSGINRFFGGGGLIGMAYANALIKSSLPSAPGIASMPHTGEAFVYKITDVLYIEEHPKEYRIDGLVLPFTLNASNSRKTKQKFIIDKKFINIESLFDELKKLQSNSAAAS